MTKNITKLHPYRIYCLCRLRPCGLFIFLLDGTRMNSQTMNSQNWFEKPLAQLLFDESHKHLEPIIAEIFGYHAVQLGLYAAGKFLVNSPIRHRVHVIEPSETSRISGRTVVAEFSDLPFLNNSIDLMLLPYISGDTSKMELLLSEVWRTLIPQGQAILLTFNPYSMWNIWPGQHKQAITFKRRSQIINILEHLGFDILKVETFFYRPPISSERWLRHLQFLDRLGAKCWSYFGACNLIVVKKTVTALTPIRPQWQTNDLAKVKGIVQPGQTNLR